MAEQEFIEKLNKFISDIEKVRDGHKMDALLTKNITFRNVHYMHVNKTAAYDFVIRKLRKTFNLNNNEKY